MSTSSGVETSVPPEWLVKLENRRERLGKVGLEHERGAGALCNVCQDKCPGLDLHFWRKVCKLCKCRKDQHAVEENDSCWAQFEILGQTRSRPTCMCLFFTILMEISILITIYVVFIYRHEYQSTGSKTTSAGLGSTKHR